MNKILYAIALLVGMVGSLVIVWVTALPEASSTKHSVASQPTLEPRKEVLRHTQSEATQSEATKVLDTPVIATIDSPETDTLSQTCTETCAQIVQMFRRSDRSVDQERIPSDKFIAQLRQDPGLQNELINIASETTGEKRRFIIAAFAQIEASSQWALGKELAAAPEFNQRLDGIHLLSNPVTMDQSIANWMGEKLTTEQNSYVRGAMVKALNKPEMFFGDTQVVEVLSGVIATDANSSVRGEALLAKARLIEDPADSLYDSLAAVRSESSEYQHYGALALGKLVDRHAVKGMQSGSQIDAGIEQLMAELMNPEFDSLPAEVRESLDNLYD